jgi:hypothetical protein
MSKLSRQKKLTVFGMKHFGFFVVLWYRITLFFTRKHGHPVETVDSINRIPEKLDFGNDYKPDPKIDTMYHPSRVQKMLDTETFKHFDCDDHAIYWATVIKKSNLAKKVWLGIVRFVVNGITEGHVVCVYQDDSGQYWWGDYNYPNKIDDKWDYAEMAAQGYASHAYAAALIEVNGVKENDTPVLGKYSCKSF